MDTSDVMLLRQLRTQAFDEPAELVDLKVHCVSYGVRRLPVIDLSQKSSWLRCWRGGPFEQCTLINLCYPCGVIPMGIVKIYRPRRARRPPVGQSYECYLCTVARREVLASIALAAP